MKALSALAVALAGMLSLELYFATQPLHVQAQPPAWSASPTQPLQARSFSALQPTVSALCNTVLSRPLFDPTRRPPAAQDPTPAVKIPRLSGIMVTPTEKIAVFAPATGPAIIVNQNSRFGPFTVLAIADDRITIKGPGGIIVLRADFSDGGTAEISTAKSTILVNGVYLSLIRVALPSAINWQGPLRVH